MHDEPTTMGGDHDWEQRQREKINLRNMGPPDPPPDDWYMRWVWPFIMLGVVVFWILIAKFAFTIWEVLHG